MTFLFAGESNTLDCQNLMNNFDSLQSLRGTSCSGKNGRSNNKTSLFGFSDKHGKNVNKNTR